MRALANVQILHGIEFKIELYGEVKGEVFQSKLKIESPVIERELTLPPVQMMGRAALNLFTPVDRIHGFGRQTRAYCLVDPIHDALAAWCPGPTRKILTVQARVLPQLEILAGEARISLCFVIE